jgi:hypothetical protein
MLKKIKLFYEFRILLIYVSSGSSQLPDKLFLSVIYTKNVVDVCEYGTSHRYHGEGGNHSPECVSFGKIPDSHNAYNYAENDTSSDDIEGNTPNYFRI